VNVKYHVQNMQATRNSLQKAKQLILQLPTVKPVLILLLI